MTSEVLEKNKLIKLNLLNLPTQKVLQGVLAVDLA